MRGEREREKIERERERAVKRLGNEEQGETRDTWDTKTREKKEQRERVNLLR